MTSYNYRECLDLTLDYEGGYVNNPRDPGGPTNRGITQKTFNAYRQLAGLPLKDVREINAAEIGEIYRKQYWNPIGGDDLPVGLDFAVYDFAVHSGVDRAVRYLQASVGSKVDGHFGLDTKSAIVNCDVEQTITSLCANRMAFLRGLKTFADFGKGWTRRVVGKADGYQANDNGVIDFALNMADQLKRGRNNIVPLQPPEAIGSRPGEQACKAVCDDLAYMPTRPLSYTDLKAGRWAA